MQQFKQANVFDQPLRRLLLARTALAATVIAHATHARIDLYSWEDQK